MLCRLHRIELYVDYSSRQIEKYLKRVLDKNMITATRKIAP